MILNRLIVMACLLAGLFTFVSEPILLISDVSTSWYSYARAPSKPEEQIELVFQITNQVREAKELAPLQRNSKLMAAAQQYAQRMADEDELSHSLGGLQLSQKAQQVGYAYQTLAENIAYNTALDGQFVVKQQWMKSKGHRQNIMARGVSQIGVGIAGPSSRTKRYYYCQIFGSPLR